MRNDYLQQFSQIFEVKINQQKLAGTFDQIWKYLLEINRKIQNTSKTINREIITSIISQQFSVIHEKQQLYQAKIDASISQINIQCKNMKDNTQEKVYQIVKNQQLKAQVLGLLQREKLLLQVTQKLQEKLIPINLSIKNLEYDLKQKNDQSHENNCENNEINDKDKAQVIDQAYQLRRNSIEKGNLQRGEKKKTKIRKMSQLNKINYDNIQKEVILSYAQFTEQIKQLQSRLSEIQDQKGRNEKVLYPSLNRNISGLERQEKQFRLHTNVFNSIKHNEFEIPQELRKNLEQFNQKNISFISKIQSFEQKYEDVMHAICKCQYTISSKIYQLTKLGIDITSINQINLRYKKIQSLFEDFEQKYVLNKYFAKQATLQNDRISLIMKKMSETAKSTEVKQAFIFIQTKIKQLVLLLSDKFQKDKQGAINKTKQINCLTCDRDIDQKCKESFQTVQKPKIALLSQKSYRNKKISMQRFYTES